MAATEIFQTLSEESRFRIFKLLLSNRGNSYTVGVISEHLNIRASVCSHHLKLLERASFVECQKSGTYRLYSVSIERAEEIKRRIIEVFDTRKDNENVQDKVDS